jgi:hypothetical protein
MQYAKLKNIKFAKSLRLRLDVHCGRKSELESGATNADCLLQWNSELEFDRITNRYSTQHRSPSLNVEPQPSVLGGIPLISLSLTLLTLPSIPQQAHAALSQDARASSPPPPVWCPILLPSFKDAGELRCPLPSSVSRAALPSLYRRAGESRRPSSPFIGESCRPSLPPPVSSVVHLSFH